MTEHSGVWIGIARIKYTPRMFKCIAGTTNEICIYYRKWLFKIKLITGFILSIAPIVDEIELKIICKEYGNEML